ncbi:hypothetical protein [Pontibacter burrus]|uniref:Uncharacterized protein n=1 Tax=Pontibacter burrus TaxID=2704466 RepID=A0A6B3LRT9_9BACT|nr:hypothetical protein [Pontibacter burrus]NEM96190.1 hypothetical protein [Pontibacter burrus]
MRQGIQAEISPSGFGVTMFFPANQDIKKSHLKRLELAGFERHKLNLRHFTKSCKPEEVVEVLQQAERLNKWLANPDNGREMIYPKRKAA